MAAAAAGHAMAISGTLSRPLPLCNHALSRSSSLHAFWFKHGRVLFAKPRVSNSSLPGTLCVYCVAGRWDPRAKDSSLVEEAAERWLRVKERPYEGISFTLEDFERSISKYEYNFDEGDVVKGRIFATDASGALVEIGAKAPAFLPLSEASLFRANSVDQIGLFIGAEDEFMVINEEDDKGRIIISLKEIQMDHAWERVRQLQSEDSIVWGTIQSVNQGGLVVMVEALKAFLPFSHTTPGKEKDHWLGKRLPLKFVEMDDEQKRLVVSHRRALAENRMDFGAGSVVIGTVQTLKPYGAFIDVGGSVNGLLHISQVSNERITDLNGVFQPGDKVKVMILSYDRDRNRISLSTKKLEPSAGDMLRNPALVFEKAEEMAMRFRQRIAQAEVESQVQARLEDNTSALNLDFLTKSVGIGRTSSNGSQ